ncbi:MULTISPECIES: hypothetical protein [Nostoc]|uniref:Uncharacterized protein n=1 Tax=Nostoc paludosum FACHB-159 TaxID=2692908 RepID=A0ABR8KGH1_9NOSO|nr:MULTISPECIES: hypothetical protein [Nostoc]MBD2737954.1 hypothetical protein [Nostoc paludosum FACHB-159]
MNFALLRQEGIKYIERLAGQLWTDYNTHDPGITILEQLCYAITDLSYRLDFEIKDLLAPSSGENRKQFFTAREILTVNPLTINDYRKLLIDIDGVKNAWLEPIKNRQLPIYYDLILHTLSFKASDFTEEINLNGLYRVMVEKEKDISDEASLLEKIKTKLNQHRNLCEDFALIEILSIEEITIKADIEVDEGFDINELMAKIYFGLDNFISPNLQFFTLKELLDRGKTPEEIFEGFPLEHGFLDDEQLESFTKKDELHTSDLIRIILDITGTKTVRNITLASDKSSELEEWALALDRNLTPQLKDIDSLVNNITFYKGQIPCNLNLAKAKTHLELLQRQNTKSISTTQIKDIPIPQGQYRELSDYESIQNDFPANYGIGELGLPASASPLRKAQAKQLQAYLMFFDRLLANYFAQLEHAKDLFSFQDKNKITYFSQDISQIPGAVEILKIDNNSSAVQWNDIDLERKNRFLNHLIAQYCEKFTDYSLLLYNSILEEKLINHKVNFLQNYPQISAGRGKAFNYTDSTQVWDTDNVSGLKKRICSLIGIPYKRQTLALSDESTKTEGFHIVEHILLRPYSSQNSEDNPNFLNFGQHISEFQSSTISNKIVTCVSQEHGLFENEHIQIFDTDNYNGIYFVTNVQQNTFDIEIETGFVKSEEGQWVQVDRPLDPYSFQLSFVFPDWQFQNENFRKLIYKIISAEMPAHITPYFHWLDKSKMQYFERYYTHWLNTIVDKNATPENLKSTSNNLIKALEIASVDIREFNVLGYMTIGTDFVVS